MEVRRPAAGPRVVGEGLVDRADPDPDVPLVLAQQRLDHAGEARRVVQDALELVARGALEGQQQGRVGQGRQRAGDQVRAGPAAALVHGQDGDGTVIGSSSVSA